MIRIYFYDHLTSWIMLVIQVLALGFALYEYLKWKKKAYDESKHKKLIELFECGTKLKNALLEFEKTLDGELEQEKLLNKNYKNDPAGSYELYKKLKSLYDKLILNNIIETETKAALILDIYGLKDPYSKIDKLIRFARKKRPHIFKSVLSFVGEDTDLPKIRNDKEINRMFEQFKNAIKNSSNLIDFKGH